MDRLGTPEHRFCAILTVKISFLIISEKPIITTKNISANKK